MPVILVTGWALLGATLALTLRPAVVHYATQAEPSAEAPPRWLLEVITAGLFAVLACRYGVHPELIAFSALATIGVPLAALDLFTQRLPNVLVGATYLALLASFGLIAAFTDNGPALLRSALCIVASFAIHLAAYVLRSLGGGDVKLAGALGAALGWISWQAFVAGLALGWMLGALAVVGLRQVRHDKVANTFVPLGPFLLAGTFAVVLLVGPGPGP